MKPTKQGGENLAIYKVVRILKHKPLGWLMTGRFVYCRILFAKNYVIRRELVRCFSPSAKQDAVIVQAKKVKALWIDSMPDPVKVNGKPKAEGKPNKDAGKVNGKSPAKVESKAKWGAKVKGSK